MPAKTYADLVIDDEGIIRNVRTVPNIPEISIGQFVIDCLDERATETLIIDSETDRHYTCEQFKTEVLKVARSMVAIGIKEGQCICMYAPNSIRHALIQVACYLTGAIYSGCYWFQTEGEFRQILSTSKPEIVFCGDVTKETSERVAKDVDHIRKVVTIDGPSWQQFLDEGDKVKPLTGPVTLATRPLEAIAAILYSSGSTGPPKAAPRTHYSLVVNCYKNRNLTRPFGPPGNIQALTMSLCHMSGMFILLATISDGMTAVLIPDADQLPKMIEKYRIQCAFMVPSTIVNWVKSGIADKYDLSSLKQIITGAGALPKDIMQPALDVLQVDNLRQLFGTSETGMLFVQPMDIICPGSVGHLVPGIDALIVDRDTGKPLGPGEVGELFIRSPEVIEGYVNNKQASEECFSKDGRRFFKTGDAMRFEEDGQFYFVDRYKEVMKVDGKQVAPAELESLLLTHAAVSEAVVVAKPDLDRGQVPVAFVVLKPGHSPSDKMAKDIIDHVNSQIIFWKHLYGGVRFIKEIPRISVGKPNRMLVKKWVNQEAIN